MRVDIWSDIVCPWCAIGKRRFEAALRIFPHFDALTVTWHSFELDPTPAANRRPFADLNELLATKYGMSRAQAQAANDRVTAVAAAEGMPWHLARAKPAATFDAHRLLHLAAGKGLQQPLMDRLMAAYFGEGIDLGDPAALTRQAVQVGMEAEEVARVLAGDRFAEAVRGDQREAARLGISGVPFFLLGGRVGVSGAQPVALLAQALAQAWADPNAHAS